VSSHAHHAAPHHGVRPTGGTRAYHVHHHHHHYRPPHRYRDHRYARPHWRYLRAHPRIGRGVPRWFYRPHYARWWVHPWYRAVYSSWCVLSFDFVVSPWVVGWMPPVRVGWTWVPGVHVTGIWVPGHWRPAGVAPVRYGVSYVYVPGYWQGDLYVEGYWRAGARSDGRWPWIEGYYTEDGIYVPGHWAPAGTTPEGYVWVAGFFDGETWVEGFWRPEYRADYVWVSAWYDEDGVYHLGYWEPVHSVVGQVWIPGWFDGHQWVEGYWVDEEEYNGADLDAWQPEEGWHDGWDEESGELWTEGSTVEGEEEQIPLALPVEIDEG